MLLNIKRNQVTNLSVGGAVLISPTTRFPAFLMVSYDHTFKSTRLESTANLPYRLALRKKLSGKNALSLINELNGTLAFYDISDKFFPQYSRYQTSEIKSGLTFEHRLGRKIILGFSTRMLYTVMSGLKEESKIAK